MVWTLYVSKKSIPLQNTSEKKARGALASRAGTTIGRGKLALVMTTR